MAATSHAAWLDAWEGERTPSPYAYRTASQRARDERWARECAREREYRQEQREVVRHAPRHEERYATRGADAWASPRRPVRPEQRPEPRPEWRRDWADASEWNGSVVHMSAAREARREAGREFAREAAHEAQRGATRGAGRAALEGTRSDLSLADTPAIDRYDWDAAAQRRPGRHECERVVLHADRCVEARMSTTHYYTVGATARREEPWQDKPRREAAPRMRVVKRRVPRWRLRLAAGLFAALVIGLTVIAPIMASSAVAGLESAVGQAELQQEQLAADNAALAAQISSLSSPQRVAEQAAQLGLAPAGEVSYLASGDQMLASEGDTAVAGR